MLLADEKGARLIVAVGTHATLVEFLDKGRGGMASTFLTRLRLGGKLVDAKGVSRLYRSRISTAALVVLVLAAFIAIGSAIAVSAAGQVVSRPPARPVEQLRVLVGEPLLVIDFRYHLVSLIAVFLAVALGIIIGTTALNQPILADIKTQVSALEKDKRSLEDRTQQLQTQVESTDAFADAVAPALVARRPRRQERAAGGHQRGRPVGHRRPADRPDRQGRRHGERHPDAAAGVQRPRDGDEPAELRHRLRPAGGRHAAAGRRPREARRRAPGEGAHGPAERRGARPGRDLVRARRPVGAEGPDRRGRLGRTGQLRGRPDGAARSPGPTPRTATPR